MFLRKLVAVSCIGMKVLPNAVTPTPCYSLQKAINQAEHFWEIKLSQYYNPVVLAVWSSSALQQSMFFSGVK